MSTLDRYLIRAILGGVLTTMAVLLSLGALFVLMGEQDDVGVGNFSTLDAVMFTALNLPQQAWELLPISALIGSLVGLGALARGSPRTLLGWSSGGASGTVPGGLGGRCRSCESSESKS